MEDQKVDVELDEGLENARYGANTLNEVNTEENKVESVNEGTPLVDCGNESRVDAPENELENIPATEDVTGKEEKEVSDTDNLNGEKERDTEKLLQGDDEKKDKVNGDVDTNGDDDDGESSGHHGDDSVGLDLVRCPCGWEEDVGPMVECARCKCWSHMICIGVSSSSHLNSIASENFRCYLCSKNVVDLSSTIAEKDKSDMETDGTSEPKPKKRCIAVEMRKAIDEVRARPQWKSVKENI
mmetsp:Transcript_12828/g.23068  ORF Transcript_12828/g.23068 Transcript_12828/m.23068 type:complete len:241 (-) Transcript_12828:383-1105(-)